MNKEKGIIREGIVNKEVLTVGVSPLLARGDVLNIILEDLGPSLPQLTHSHKLLRI